MDQWIARINIDGKMTLFAQYFIIIMTENNSQLPEKYRLLEAFLEQAFYRIRCLLPRDIVDNEPLLDDYISLMIVAVISQSIDFEISKRNIDLVENLSPQITQILEDFKNNMAEEARDALQNSSTVVD